MSTKLNNYTVGFFDLDGTLLVGNRKYSKQSKDIILQLQQNKIECVIATGRAYSGVNFLHDELNIRYFILNNGCSIYDSKTHNEYFQHFLPFEDLINIKKNFLDKFKKKIRILVYTDKNIYTNKKMYPWLNVFAQSFNYSIIVKKNIYTFLKTHEEKNKIYRIFIIINRKVQEKKIKLIKTLEQKYTVNFFKFGITFTKNTTDKGIAAEYLLKNILHTTFDKTFALGDNYNDIPLAKKVKTFIAMPNAEDKRINKYSIYKYNKKIHPNERISHPIKDIILKCYDN